MKKMFIAAAAFLMMAPLANAQYNRPGNGGHGRPGHGGGYNPGHGGYNPGHGGHRPGHGGYNPGHGGYNPGRPGGYNPGRPGGYNPGRPGGYNPGRPGGYPGYQVTCFASDVGYEEHAWQGGHSGVGQTQYQAQANALSICQSFHQRCQVTSCR